MRNFLRFFGHNLMIGARFVTHNMWIGAVEFFVPLIMLKRAVVAFFKERDRITDEIVNRKAHEPK